MGIAALKDPSIFQRARRGFESAAGPGASDRGARAAEALELAEEYEALLRALRETEDEELDGEIESEIEIENENENESEIEMEEIAYDALPTHNLLDPYLPESAALEFTHAAIRAEAERAERAERAKQAAEKAGEKAAKGVGSAASPNAPSSSMGSHAVPRLSTWWPDSEVVQSHLLHLLQESLTLHPPPP